ncbi:MAG: nitrogenase molybdenum-iron protein, alpha and beta chain [Clostridiales Family XIII bacterium]|jgi:nitrogenase molybdenum-iron protein beta chain|nr:nitrogenase molybdenum-iron protein, alpha and beta chain [Clostridiales Family XIII bacterium]
MGTNCVEKTRVGCAIAGMFTAIAIDGVLPVFHGGAGCIGMAEGFIGSANGRQGMVDYFNGAIPSTNLIESDVVFGAEKKLEKTIRTAKKFFDTDLITVISGCASGIIGEDVESVVSNFEGTQPPVVFADTPGFAGNNIFGHERVLDAIIDGLATPVYNEGVEINPKQVNVFGIIPYYDPYWLGTYDAIEALLAEVGLEANVIYGPGKGKAAVEKIPQAAFNLVLSPWWDVASVKKLEEKYKTPYLHYPNFPIGPTETKRFLKVLTEYAHLDEAVVDAYIKKKDERFYYYIKRSIDWMYGGKNLPQNFYALVNSNLAVGITKFLVNDFGYGPQLVFALDEPTDEVGVAKIFKEQLSELETDQEIKIEIVPDPADAMQKVRDHKKLHSFRASQTIVFGSNWDKELAQETGSIFVPISAPVSKVIYARNYFGYDGGLTFLEDYYNSVENIGQRIREKEVS